MQEPTQRNISTYHISQSKKIIFIIGVMADKDLDTMIPAIADLAGQFIAVTPNYPGRAMAAEVLKEHLEKYDVPVMAAGSIKEGVESALKAAGRDGIICALGSLYMPIDVKKSIEELLN